MQTLNLEAPKMRPYGQRVGNLTRFGETWFDLDQIVAVEFNPEDGCGAEVAMRGDECWHVPIEDAECLRAYLTGFESLQQRVDEAAVQSREIPASSNQRS